MSWQLASFAILAAVLIGGFAWYERSRPPSQVVALVAAMAALAIAGRIAFAAFPNVKPTTDIVILAGYALGAAPGFAVGALTALVSNFWFGQGPWTPWQMLGWGLCGILGAVLAVRVRDAGRMTLAITCALAGVGYGALLNFSLMATYGGDLSMQRFLALEARGIPFDAAHAIGNFALALAAGPAMIRMLTRFRRRFEWRTPAFAGAIVVALALVAAAPAQAEAAGPGSAADWLESVQNGDGGWGADPGAASGVEITAWAMLGLASADRNPLDVSSGGRTPVDYLRSNVRELNSAGDYARTILALNAAGVSPRDFGGTDLVSTLGRRRGSNGSFEGKPGTTAYAVMALRAAGAGGGLDATLSWLAKAQNADGGWGDLPGSESTADVTGAVMQAMSSTDVGRHGLGFLRKKAQRPNGGFPGGGSIPANSQSTAWALQGMIAVGASSGSALDYLSARQGSDGHYSYSSSSNQTPVWVTAQVIPAVAGEAFPVSAPPRKPKPKPAPAPTPAPVAPFTPPPATGGEGGIPPVTTAPSEPPSSGGGSSGSPISPSIPGLPPTSPGLPETLPETAPESIEGNAEQASFNPKPPEAPSPLISAAIGLGAAAVTIGSVVLLGRRFGW